MLPSSPPPSILLLACGSYSPPTPMHLRIFEIAKDHFLQTKSHRVLGGIVSPVHDSYTKPGLIKAVHRCSMLKLALKSSEWVRLSDWECNQKSWCTTATCVQYHENFINNYINDINGAISDLLPSWLPRGLHGQVGQVQVKLLCGADLLESFNVPGLWCKEDIEEIVRNHGLVVISRAGAWPEKFIFESDLLTKYKDNIIVITNWVSNEVCSSLVRRLLHRGQSVKYLLDDAVIEYISKHKLYRKEDGQKEEVTPKRRGHHRKVGRREFEPMDITDFPSAIQADVIHEEELNGVNGTEAAPAAEDAGEIGFSDFLKHAIESRRIRVMRKEHFYV